MSGIPERLKMIRERFGVDQGTFAVEIGIGSRSTVSSWERGVSVPSADALASIRTKYRVSIDWLVTGEGDMEGGCTQTTGPVQLKALEEIIAGVEEGLERNGRVLDPDRKAQLIVLLYEHFVQGQSEVKKETVERYLKLVV